MIIRILFLLFSWTAPLIGADPAQGLNYETAVPLRALFFHETPDAVQEWLKIHVPDAELSENGETTSFSQRKEYKGREYHIEHVRLRTKAVVAFHFEIVDPLPDHAMNVEELFVFPEYLQIVQQFDSAEAFVLKVPNNAASEETIFKRVPGEIAGLFRSALLSESSYNWSAHSLCGPVYVARLRLHSGEKALDIDFCFQCSQMQIRTETRSLPRRDFTSSAFRELFSKLFPEQKNFRPQ